VTPSGIEPAVFRFVAKCQGVPVHAIKAWSGVEVQLYLLFTSVLEIGEFSAIRTGRFTPKGKASRCPLKRRRLGEPEARSGRFGEEINLLSMLGIDLLFIGRPARRLVHTSAHTPIVLKL